MVFTRSATTNAQIKDGTSHTVRWYNYQPEQDRSGWAGHGWEEGFGSAHPAVFHVAFCDGAVRGLSYSIDLETFKRLGNRADGEVVSLEP